MSPSRNTWRRWAVRIAVAMLLIIALASAAVWRWGGAYTHTLVQEKLQEVVSGHLQARLEMGELRYRYPYGVEVDDVAIVSEIPGQPAEQLASFKQLRLHLGEVPRPDRPLVIERIDIDSPTLHVIRGREGVVSRKELVRAEPAGVTRPKLSDVFHLRHLQLNNARVQYEDRRENSRSLVWDDIDLALEAQPVGGASHTFQFTAVTGSLGWIESSGTLDIDSLVLQLDQLKIRTHVAPDDTISPLPPFAQDILKRFAVAGDAGVWIAGTMPLRSPDESRLSASLWIENAAGVYAGQTLSELDFALDAKLTGRQVKGRVARLIARSGKGALSVQPLDLAYDLDARRWQAGEVRLAAAYTPSAATQPDAQFPFSLMASATLEQIDARESARVTFSNAQLTLPSVNETLNLAGVVSYQDDRLSVASLTITGLDGETTGEGSVAFPSKSFEFAAKTQNLRVAPLHALMNPESGRELQGRLTGELTLKSADGTFQAAEGAGKLRIVDGRFARVPILSKIAGAIGIGEGLFVAETAYARFTVGDQIIVLDRVAVSSNALRLRGQGMIGFDRTLDLRVFVTNAGNWEKALKESGIPLLDNVGAALAGGTQKVIGGLSSQISTFRVTGTTSDPKVTPEPLPVLTDGIRKLLSGEEY